MVEETVGHPTNAVLIVLLPYMIVGMAIEIALVVLIYYICCWIFVGAYSEKSRYWRKTTAKKAESSDHNRKVKFIFTANDKIFKCKKRGFKKYGTEIIYNIKFPKINILANRKFWFRRIFFQFALLIFLLIFFKVALWYTISFLN